MSDGLAFVNGGYMVHSKAQASTFDRGLSGGNGIYDVAQTVSHVHNKLIAHFERPYRSARYTRISLPYSEDELAQILRRVLDHNLKDFDPDDDDRILWLLATRGIDLVLPVVEGDCYLYDGLAADDVVLTMVSAPTLPTSRFSGRPLATGPGRVTARLMHS